MRQLTSAALLILVATFGLAGCSGDAGTVDSGGVSLVISNFNGLPSLVGMEQAAAAGPGERSTRSRSSSIIQNPALGQTDLQTIRAAQLRGRLHPGRQRDAGADAPGRRLDQHRARRAAPPRSTICRSCGASSSSTRRSRISCSSTAEPTTRPGLDIIKLNLRIRFFGRTLSGREVVSLPQTFADRVPTDSVGVGLCSTSDSRSIAAASLSARPSCPFSGSRSASPPAARTPRASRTSRRAIRRTPNNAVWNITVNLSSPEMPAGSTDTITVRVRVQRRDNGQPPPNGTTVVLAASAGTFAAQRDPALQRPGRRPLHAAGPAGVRHGDHPGPPGGRRRAGACSASWSRRPSSSASIQPNSGSPNGGEQVVDRRRRVRVAGAGDLRRRSGAGPVGGEQPHPGPDAAVGDHGRTPARASPSA